jgi:hypothetical protein
VGGTLYVFSRGIVSAARNAVVQSYYAAPGRKIELWLVNTGARHVQPELLKPVTQQIADKP